MAASASMDLPVHAHTDAAEAKMPQVHQHTDEDAQNPSNGTHMVDPSAGELPMKIEPAENHEASSPFLVVRLRGLPWHAETSHVLKFISASDVKVPPEDIFLVQNIRGDAYIVLQNQTQVDELLKLHRQRIDSRYIEVFEARWEEYNEERYYIEHKLECDMNYPSALGVSGLPEDVSEEELMNHFRMYGVVPGHAHILVDEKRRPTGEALLLLEREGKANLAYQAKKGTEIRSGYPIRITVKTRGEVFDKINTDVSKNVKPANIHRSRESDSAVVRVRGLPDDCLPSDLLEGLGAWKYSHEARVVLPWKVGISAHIHSSTNKPWNEDRRTPVHDAFVICDTVEGAIALKSQSQAEVKGISVQVEQCEMVDVMRAIGCCAIFLRKPDATTKNVVKLGNLPFTAKAQDIQSIVNGFSLGELGVVVITCQDGRTCVGAFVELVSEEEALRLIEHVKEIKIGGRDTTSEITYKSALLCCHPFSSPSKDKPGYRSMAMTCMKVKGMPYEVQESEVYEFFAGLRVMGLALCSSGTGPQGQAYIEFAYLEDMLYAYALNRCDMGGRYVDLVPVEKQEALTHARTRINAHESSKDDLRTHSHRPLPSHSSHTRTPPRYESTRERNSYVHERRGSDHGTGVSYPGRRDRYLSSVERGRAADRYLPLPLDKLGRDRSRSRDRYVVAVDRDRRDRYPATVPVPVTSAARGRSRDRYVDADRDRDRRNQYASHVDIDRDRSREAFVNRDVSRDQYAVRDRERERDRERFINGDLKADRYIIGDRALRVDAARSRGADSSYLHDDAGVGVVVRRARSRSRDRYADRAADMVRTRVADRDRYMEGGRVVDRNDRDRDRSRVIDRDVFGAIGRDRDPVRVLDRYDYVERSRDVDRVVGMRVADRGRDRDIGRDELIHMHTHAREARRYADPVRDRDIDREYIPSQRYRSVSREAIGDSHSRAYRSHHAPAIPDTRVHTYAHTNSRRSASPQHRNPHPAPKPDRQYTHTRTSGGSEAWHHPFTSTHAQIRDRETADRGRNPNSNTLARDRDGPRSNHNPDHSRRTWDTRRPH